MMFRPIALGALAVLAGIAALDAVATAQEPPRPDQLVDALNGVYGKHPGDRAAHSKGICLTGQFTPSPEASGATRPTIRPRDGTMRTTASWRRSARSRSTPSHRI